MPINFGVEVTNICNANCKFCGYRFQTRKKGVMDDNIFRKAIDEYCAIGGGDINLTPTVGDTLIDKNLLNKIRYARSKRKISKIWFYTNLIAFANFDVEDFLLSGLSTLRISTCIKDAAAYYNVYHVNRYNEVLENIENLCERNKQLNYPVDVKLYLRIPKPFEEAYEMGDYKRIAKYFNHDDIYILDDLYDSWSGRIKENDLPFGNKIYTNTNDMNSEPCYELFRRVNILYDGRVNNCVCRDLNAELTIGNILTQSIVDIWRGNELNNLRKRWFKGEIPEVCKGCQRYIPVNSFFIKQHNGIVRKYIKQIFNNKFQ